MEYLLVLTAAISVGLPLTERFGLNPIYVNSLLSWPLFSSVALLYFLAGYYVHTYWKPIRHQTAIMAVLFVASSAGMALLGAWSNGYAKPSGLNTQYDSYYVGITSPLCVMQAIALFLLAQSAERWLRSIPERALRVVKLLSSAALGVYLFHTVLINWMGVSLPSAIANTLGMLPLTKAVVVYVVTVALVIAGTWLIARCKSLLPHWM